MFYLKSRVFVQLLDSSDKVTMINIDKIIKNALDEDIDAGDITTDSIIGRTKSGNAIIVAKDEGIISGQFVAKRICGLTDKSLNYKICKDDSTYVFKGEIISEIHGKIYQILLIERTMLNFLQRMSGIATKTNKFIIKIKKSKTKLLDTRKTVPGLRILDKYAVRCGGGYNHRMNLNESILIKENHIQSAGSIKNAFLKAQKKYPEKFIEIETTNLRQLDEVLKLKPDRVMFDNFSIKDIISGLKIIKHRIPVELSGNITYENIEEYAYLGAEYISIGELTHSVKSYDLSLLIM